MSPFYLPQKYTSKVTFKTNLSSHFAHLIMQKPEGFNYLAGQYVSLVVGENVRRAYSLCNWVSMGNEGNVRDKGDMLELLVDTKAGGLGAKYVESLKVSDPIEFWGPYGSFVIPENIYGNIWFVGTGSGVAPLKAQVERMLGGIGEMREMRVIYGTRVEEDIVFLKNFENLAKTVKQFYYHVALSQPTVGFNPEWGEYWHKGHVTEIAQELLKKEKPDYVFLCGHPDMMRDAIKMFSEAGVPQNQILFEKFS